MSEATSGTLGMGNALSYWRYLGLCCGVAEPKPVFLEARVAGPGGVRGQYRDWWPSRGVEERLSRLRAGDVGYFLSPSLAKGVLETGWTLWKVRGDAELEQLTLLAAALWTLTNDRGRGWTGRPFVLAHQLLCQVVAPKLERRVPGGWGLWHHRVTAALPAQADALVGLTRPEEPEGVLAVAHALCRLTVAEWTLVQLTVEGA